MHAMIELRNMRTDRSTALILSMAFLLAIAVLLYPATAEAQESNATDSLYGEAQQILSAFNAHRRAAGLGPLVADPLLNQAAQAHADDILNNYNNSHRGSDGSLARQRVARTGYAANPWVSENWVSSTSAEHAMTWWMNDYIHRVNILMPRWNEVGIGAAVRHETGEMVFVTVFSAGRDASASVPVASASAVAYPVAVAAGGTEYVVQPGDTLLDIAYRYEMDWTEIAAANSVADDTLLQIGRVLRIPDADGEYIGSSPETVQGIGGPAIGEGREYVIQPGETLFSIAIENGTTWQELARTNGLSDGTILQIGQTIQIPVPATAEAPNDAVSAPAEDLAVLHLVEAGDTVFGIALAYAVDWQALLSLNTLNEESILQPGQAIRLR